MSVEKHLPDTGCTANVRHTRTWHFGSGGLNLAPDRFPLLRSSRFPGLEESLVEIRKVILQIPMAAA